MGCGCTSRVSHLLLLPASTPWSSLISARRRVSLRSSTGHPSTLASRAARHGTTLPFPLRGVPQCSSSSPSTRSSSSSPSSSMSCRSSIDMHSEAAMPSETQLWRITFPSYKLLAGCVLVTAVTYGFHVKAALAVAENSIAASGLGVKVATFLRGSGWPDELIVFTVAMLPVLELRGAIPISYWLNLDPIKGYILSVLGNMVPVPLVVLYLEKLSNFLGEKSNTAKRFLTWLVEKSRQKGGVIEEFEWLGLMLFVAVPFPGTGAWTGAFLAALLGMPFWEAFTANFCGVLLAGLLVNLVVTVGAKYALGVGATLFVISTFMWNVLRLVKKKNTDAT